MLMVIFKLILTAKGHFMKSVKSFKCTHILWLHLVDGSNINIIKNNKI